MERADSVGETELGGGVAQGSACEEGHDGRLGRVCGGAEVIEIRLIYCE